MQVAGSRGDCSDAILVERYILRKSNADTDANRITNYKRRNHDTRSNANQNNSPCYTTFNSLHVGGGVETRRSSSP